MKLPWSDCKVAFPYSFVDDPDEVWDEIDNYKLPKGWELDETDSTGARVVVIFRITGLLRVEDGEIVKKILRDIIKKIKKRLIKK